MKKIDQESINTLRFLSIDEVQAANPGLPLERLRLCIRSGIVS